MVDTVVIVINAGSDRRLIEKILEVVLEKEPVKRPVTLPQ